MIELVDVYSHPQHEVILYRLLRERSTEDDRFVNISHRKLPSWEEHEAFVQRNPYWCWYFIMIPKEDGGEPWVAGTIYVTRRNEIGIILFKAFRGKRIGTEALGALLAKEKPQPAIPGERSGQFIANINPGNEASKRLFSYYGFKIVQETWGL